MSRIKLLPDSVANQIAAGEVVNRPASVVKELMENAVDAGARSITLNFRDGGRELIQIKDDGCGMSPQDARMAFERHATSKITSVDDIYSLLTFGFRGEALPSIAAVAQVEMHTRPAAQELGTQLLIDGGNFRGQEAVAAPGGTQIWIRNLFYNVPARKKFLDRGTSEATHIITEFQRVALAHPNVSFTLFRDDAPLYNLPAASQDASESAALHQRVVGILGKGAIGKLLEIGVETSIAQIRGFVGRPEAARQRTREQFLFVNGRFFKSAFFHKAVLAAYEKLIPQTTQPPYFIYLEIDPEQIDVNVHPQKTEVKFVDQGAVWQIINAAVREALAKSGSVPMMDFDAEERIEIPVLGGHAGLGAPTGQGERMGAQRTNYEYPTIKEPAVVKASDYNPFRNYRTEEAHLEFASEPVAFSHITPLGEGVATALYGSLFVAVDLRRAREAVLFERLGKILQAGHSASQQLLFPERMALSADDASLLKDHVDEFSALGFDIRSEGEHSIEILGTPPEVPLETLDEVIYEMLDALRDGTFDGENRKQQKLAAVMARAASSATKTARMTQAETETLLGALLDAGNPSFTPAGKPVMTEITIEEIKNKLR